MKKIFRMERTLVSVARPIANPVKVVLKETQRAFMEFCLYEMSIDAVIMNILLPKQVAACKSVRAKIEEPYLNITFEGEIHEQSGA